MGKFVVFNAVKWKPPVRSKLLTAPEIKLDVSFPDTDLREMTKKHRAEFDKAFKAFDSEFHKLGTAKIKEIQSAIQWTEDRIQKMKSKKEAEKTVEVANVMLRKAFATFESQIRKLAQKCYEEALEKAARAMKMRMVKAIAKAVVVITIIALITLTAAGIAIAAGVGTAGVGLAAAGGAAAIVAGIAGLTGAIVSGLIGAVTAVASVVSTIKKYWPTVERQIGVVEKDIESMTKAVKTLEELAQLARTGHEPARDKFKKLKAGFDGALVNFDKHVGQLDKFIFKASRELEKTTRQLDKVTKQLNKTKARELQKKADKLLYDTMKSIGLLRRIGNVQAEAKAVEAQFAKYKAPKLGKLRGILREARDIAPVVSDIGKGAKELIDSAKKLKAA